ncbi:MAG: hypothetical protein KatS3mg096_615 [Candidatus Parcubacteria bacterium]|nr:MAG: hypothetical protein KatS3mg096_615 [Candidatus Parcubacteria bacterium]
MEELVLDLQQVPVLNDIYVNIATIKEYLIKDGLCRIKTNYGVCYLEEKYFNSDMESLPIIQFPRPINELNKKTGKDGCVYMFNKILPIINTNLILSKPDAKYFNYYSFIGNKEGDSIRFDEIVKLLDVITQRQGKSLVYKICFMLFKFNDMKVDDIVTYFNYRYDDSLGCFDISFGIKYQEYEHEPSIKIYSNKEILLNYIKSFKFVKSN